MASFNEVDGIPATASKWLMTDVLRNQWGFQGFVVTDYTGIYEMIDHGIGDLQTVAARAVNAGVDGERCFCRNIETVGAGRKGIHADY